MDVREQIIEFIRTRGPVLPVQVAKEVNTNILLASANLAELKSQKKIKISHLKIGSSPLYYLSGQEIRLQSFANNLNEKERKAYDLLRENKVLRENNVDPVIRIALRNIKDFSIPLQVNYQEKSEIFWRWYLIDDNEAERLIKDLIKPKEAIEEKLKPSTIEKEIVKEKKEIKKEIKEELKPSEKQKIIPPRIIEKRIDKKINASFKKVEDYFGKNKIEVIQYVGEGKEDSIVRIPSPIGPLWYFCKIKNKKKINDGDLSSLVIQAQSKKLPALLITSGEPTKKAKELLENEFKGVVVVKL